MTSEGKSVTIADVSSAYEDADQAIKQNERFTLASPWAAVNQLRCAGYHLLHAKIEEPGGEGEQYHLAKAQGHCRRAAFDAFEGIIYSHLDFIARVQDICRARRNIESVYPDYRADYDAIAAIRERLQICLQVQRMTDGERKEVLDVAEQLKHFKWKILRKMVEIQSLERTNPDEETFVAVRQFLVPFVATIVGTLVGIIGLGLGIWSIGISIPLRLTLIGVTLLACGWFTKKFYRWSANHLLTNRQRKLLQNQYGLTLR